MNRLIALAGATMLATAGVAIAQDMPASQGTPDSSATAPAASTTTSQPTTASAPTSATDQSASAPAPTTDQSASAPEPSTTQTASATAAPTPNPSVVAEVQSKWATYDTKNTGKLTPLEFGEWVMAAKGNDVSKAVEKTKASKASNLAATKVLNATGSAFAKADTNKDGGVSPDELAAFLSA
ncbi:EF-hand domain-containing protein [Flavisphingomonas formosensis]|uniref:hypothetical protein n=1 Tax=Flavisphingomonas formosensis TaxID=861534 RepID=UPI0012FB0D4E|nr:hypothetical protein [Sphingomonas formosensis]